MYTGRLAKATSEERPEATRYPVTWPVEFECGTGVTRDLSADGAVVTTDLVLSEGESVHFAVSIPERLGGPSRVLVQGRVIRVKPLGAHWEVAVSFDAVRFEV
jgi:hypothetical protein